MIFNYYFSLTGKTITINWNINLQLQKAGNRSLLTKTQDAPFHPQITKVRFSLLWSFVSTQFRHKFTGSFGVKSKRNDQLFLLPAVSECPNYPIPCPQITKVRFSFLWSFASVRFGHKIYKQESAKMFRLYPREWLRKGGP